MPPTRATANTRKFPPKMWGSAQGIVVSMDPLVVGKRLAQQKTKALQATNVPGLKLFVREDLGMSKGKAAAQCCHAAVGLTLLQDEHAYQDGLIEWWKQGAPMEVYSADSEQNLFVISSMAKAKGERTIVIRDAGRTQIKSGSRTVCGIAPSEVDLGDLKLY